MTSFRSLLLMAAALLSLSNLAAMPALPPTPAGIEGVILARSFTLDTGFANEWSADRSPVVDGTILVLEVAPELIFPRETAEPVLYVGGHAAWRISRYNGSGRMVIFVPGRIDLATTSIWFGSPGLPEQVDISRIRQERSLAAREGIKPLPRSVLQAASERGGSAHYNGKLELMLALDQLVQEFVAPHRNLE